MDRITTVRLPDDIVNAMQALQTRDGIPPSEQIRRALQEWLSQKKVGYKPPKKDQRKK
jgi:Arc/MetJ-type ribon-helix-helix transcriptional regulator